ncbi:MAG: PilN domain-containing protein [Patescibacteria group bacterium]
MNLLPPHYKAGLRLEAWRRFLVFFGIYLSVIGVAAVMLLLPSYFFLQFQIDELKALEETTKASPDYKSMEEGKKTVSRVGRLLSTTNQFFVSDTEATPLIEDIVSRMPASVSLSDFSYSRAEGAPATLKLTGIAGHRDDLTKFAEDLQKSPYIKEKISVPESSYLREFDTPFALSITISPAKQ